MIAVCAWWRRIESSSVARQRVSDLFPRCVMLATGRERGLTVFVAPNEFLMSVRRRSEVAVGKCVGRQDLRRKRGASGFSTRAFTLKFSSTSLRRALSQIFCHWRTLSTASSGDLAFEILLFVSIMSIDFKGFGARRRFKNILTHGGRRSFCSQ